MNDARPLLMDLIETAAIVCRSIVALGSLAVPTRLRFGLNDGIPHIIGTGFVMDGRGVVMTAGHVARALTFCAERNAIRIGLDVAFAGFPFGSDGLVLRIDDQPPMVVQATPFLRHGVVSSVHPFPCPQPHGFSIDAISHGGASGSPIFRRDDPAVLGMLYAAFEGQGLTYALPGHLLHWAATAALADGTIDLDGVPSLNEYRTTGQRA